MGDMDLAGEGGVSAVMGDTDRQRVIDDLTGGGERTAEDVIAETVWVKGEPQPLVAQVVLNALAAAGYAVVPQADVDAATRLQEAITEHRRTRSSFPLRADELLWEAAAAVGSVDPEGAATPEPYPTISENRI